MDDELKAIYYIHIVHQQYQSTSGEQRQKMEWCREG